MSEICIHTAEVQVSRIATALSRATRHTPSHSFGVSVPQIKVTVLDELIADINLKARKRQTTTKKSLLDNPKGRRFVENKKRREGTLSVKKEQGACKNEGKNNGIVVT